ESMWRDIATAPRDPQQWFWALSKRSGATYHARWCPERQCFIHTKTNNRVNPTHWREDFLASMRPSPGWRGGRAPRCARRRCSAALLTRLHLAVAFERDVAIRAANAP